MKVIIAGSRTIIDYKIVATYVIGILHLLHPEIVDEILGGGAKGVDTIAEKFANIWGFKFKLFLANWDKYGKKAGYLRNVEMANYAEVLILIWDGKSKGSKLMLDIAKQKGLKIFEYKIGGKK